MWGGGGEGITNRVKTEAKRRVQRLRELERLGGGSGSERGREMGIVGETRWVEKQKGRG